MLGELASPSLHYFRYQQSFIQLLNPKTEESFLIPLSLPLLDSAQHTKSCQFSFHYKSYIITSHHFTFTTYPGLQEQLPSCSPCILFCPLQFVFYRSAKPTLQTLNQITSFPRLKLSHVFPLYSKHSLRSGFIFCPLSLAH